MAENWGVFVQGIVCLELLFIIFSRRCVVTLIKSSEINKN